MDTQGSWLNLRAQGKCVEEMTTQLSLIIVFLPDNYNFWKIFLHLSVLKPKVLKVFSCSEF